jgi:hypothetical protein
MVGVYVWAFSGGEHISLIQPALGSHSGEPIRHYAAMSSYLDLSRDIAPCPFILADPPGSSFLCPAPPPTHSTSSVRPSIHPRPRTYLRSQRSSSSTTRHTRPPILYRLTPPPPPSPSGTHALPQHVRQSAAARAQAVGGDAQGRAARVERVGKGV